MALQPFCFALASSTQSVRLLSRPLSTHTSRINTHTNIHVSSAIRTQERAKTIHTLDRAATVIVLLIKYLVIMRLRYSCPNRQFGNSELKFVFLTKYLVIVS
jgi:hypothetical protein